VLTFDGRGNGRSDRPAQPDAYDDEQFALDTLAVMDANEIARAAIVSLSAGSRWALMLAARHPERIAAAAFIGPNVPIGAPIAERAAAMGAFDAPHEHYGGWKKYNSHYWRSNYRGFLEFFFSQCLCELHSTKQIEDCVGWGMETTPEMLIATQYARSMSERDAAELAATVRCPVFVINGDDDRITGCDRGAGLARATGGTLVTLEGSGHLPHTRDPVRVNLALRSFLDPRPATTSWQRARGRRKRALYISSPIGLGHAQRDVAIARELRKLHPDLEIDWFAQHPVTKVLEANGERIHPASAFLASESAHIEGESAEHDLHCFQALRRMDEILIANFMLFHDIVTEEHYDLWIGDEAWELDYYLHENPELKRAPYVWMTDFVGYLPMPDGGERVRRRQRVSGDRSVAEDCDVGAFTKRLGDADRQLREGRIERHARAGAAREPEGDWPAAVLGVADRRPDHLPELALVLRGHEHDARQRTEVGNVEEALVGPAVVADDPPAIHGEYDRQLLDRDVVDHLIEAALQERRIDRDDRDDPLRR